MRVTTVMTGLPRHFESKLAGIVRSYNKISTRVGGYFWDYGNQIAPVTNPNHSKVPVTESDWQRLKSYGFNRIATSQPVDVVENENFRHHPQVEELNLRPNLTATRSWMAAISRSIDLLRQMDPDQNSDLWIVTRADAALLNTHSAKRGLSYFLRLRPRERGLIGVASRPYGHFVLNYEGKKYDLPIDHWFIGSPSDIEKLERLETYLEDQLRMPETKQPLVNEFIVGQFLLDEGLTAVSISLPYVVWRGSLRTSLVAYSQEARMARLKSLLENVVLKLTWLARPSCQIRPPKNF